MAAKAGLSAPVSLLTLISSGAPWKTDAAAPVKEVGGKNAGWDAELHTSYGRESIKPGGYNDMAKELRLLRVSRRMGQLSFQKNWNRNRRRRHPNHPRILGPKTHCSIRLGEMDYRAQEIRTGQHREVSLACHLQSRAGRRGTAGFRVRSPIPSSTVAADDLPGPRQKSRPICTPRLVASFLFSS